MQLALLGGERTLDAVPQPIRTGLLLAAEDCREQRHAEVMGKHTGSSRARRTDRGDWKHICSVFDPAFCTPAGRSPQPPTPRLTRKQY